jgi:hypothetical protein
MPLSCVTSLPDTEKELEECVKDRIHMLAVLLCHGG